jgi:hypothetical protein
MKVIVFANKAIADEICEEIGCSPFGLVAVYYNFEAAPEDNVVQRNNEPAGRCLVSHPFCEEDRDWFEAYMAEWIATGEVRILDAIPDDWAYGQEVL